MACPTIHSRRWWRQDPSAGSLASEKDGAANLAPYSFFNAVAERPHYVVFGSYGRKDSVRNVEETGEFAVNLANWELREAMNPSSAEVPQHVDEFELAGLARAPCRHIKALRVAASPANLECCLVQNRATDER
jgi:flavin reductase (DIM6/NTAB) family NADH-FMN oxidoreductase RutF